MRNLTAPEWVFGAIFLLAFTFFVYVDFYLANEITASIAYMSLLGFGLLANSKRLTILIGIAGIIATIAGIYFIPSGEMDVTNRQLVVIAIATVTLTCHIYMERQNILETQLFRIANTDMLTGIANRRSLLEEIEQRLSESLRYKKDLSIIMFDLDDFKEINDKYGHLAGDKMLKKITETVLKYLRITDVMGRYGGEEFLIICPNTPLSGAMILAERIRKAIESATFRLDDDMLKITVSMGVTELRGHINMGSQSSMRVQLSHYLIGAADTALYKAKKDGKNCTVAFNPHSDLVEEDSVPVSN